MSRIFLRPRDDQWVDYPLSAGSVALHALWAAPSNGLDGPTPITCSAIHLAPAQVGVATRWVAIHGADSGLRVNGVPLGGLGLRVLEHKDEIAVPVFGSAFFSTEEFPVVVPFPGAARPVFCGRCLDPIDAAAPAVQCPHCRVWHHQMEQRECFTYDVCSGCRRPTSLDHQLEWRPEE
jgi:hypothetical protein